MLNPQLVAGDSGRYHPRQVGDSPAKDWRIAYPGYCRHVESKIVDCGVCVYPEGITSQSEGLAHRLP